MGSGLWRDHRDNPGEEVALDLRAGAARKGGLWGLEQPEAVAPGPTWGHLRRCVLRSVPSGRWGWAGALSGHKDVRSPAQGEHAGLGGNQAPAAA